MNEENTEKLFNDFPEFFDRRKEGMMVSLMCFGFECADGWHNLIYNLCSDIKEWFLNNESNHIMGEDCDGGYIFEKRKGIPPQFQVHQVKEKFGGLRFYIGGAPKAIYDMIHKAEHDSFFICEHCGNDVREQKYDDKEYHSYYRDDLGWILTLCDECLCEHLKKRNLSCNKDYVSDWQKEHNAPFITG